MCGHEAKVQNSEHRSEFLVLFLKMTCESCKVKVNGKVTGL
nr:hypothetical protein [uncultured Nitrososphaera sp.]